MNQMEPGPVAADAGESQAAEPAGPPVSVPLVTPWHLLFLALALLGLWLFFSRNWHRLDRPPSGCAGLGTPRRPQAFGPPVGIALFIGAIILAQLGGQAGSNVFGIDLQQPRDLRDVALIGLSRYLAEALVIIIFAVLIFTATKPQPDRRAGLVKAVLAGAGALLLFWPMVMSLAWLINLAMHLFRGWVPDPIAHETLALLIEADRAIWFFIMAGLALVVAPIFEEVLYRGVLQETLIRLEFPRWYAIATTSVIFAIMHITAAPSAEARPAMLAVLFVLSLGFGWIYEKTGRLAAPITMHVLFNAGNLAAAMWAA